MAGRLEGKRAIVSGAASGIGRASARIFGREGAKVLALDVQEEGLADTVDEIVKEGGTARGLRVDVGNE